MEMNFFTRMAAYCHSSDITMTLRGGENQITVSILPRSTQAGVTTGNMKPLVLSGTPEEIDLFFFDTIHKPMEATAGILQNITSYETALQAEQKVLDEKKKKAQEKKEQEAKAKAEKDKKGKKPVQGKTSGASASDSEDDDGRSERRSIYS